MADVVQTNLREPDLIDFDKIEDGGASTNYAPPAEGLYFGKAPLITDDSFGTTQAGYLNVLLDPITIVNSEVGNDYKLRFTRLSAKKYTNRNSSQMIDFLRACGIAARPTTNDQLKQALKMASGRTFQFALQWEAYNKDAQESTKGQENFPPDPSNPSKRLPYIVDTYDTSKRWWANGRVRFFVSAIKG